MLLTDGEFEGVERQKRQFMCLASTQQEVTVYVVQFVPKSYIANNHPKRIKDFFSIFLI